MVFVISLPLFFGYNPDNPAMQFVEKVMDTIAERELSSRHRRHVPAARGAHHVPDSHRAAFFMDIDQKNTWRCISR
jgi:hypothetical protein